MQENAKRVHEMLKTKVICNVQRMRPRITILSSLANLPEIESDLIFILSETLRNIVDIRDHYHWKAGELGQALGL